MTTLNEKRGFAIIIVIIVCMLIRYAYMGRKNTGSRFPFPSSMNKMRAMRIPTIHSNIDTPSLRTRPAK